MAKIIVVTSGKGGVGKTTTSASIASGLALRGHKTAVIDFDVGLRNLDLIMGCERRVVYDLINVIQGEATLNQALIKDKHCDKLFILPASQTRDKDALTKEGVEKVLALVERSKNTQIGDKSMVWNTARIEALELDNLIEVAKATLVSAEARKESRGAHASDDHPERDDENWMKHTLYHSNTNTLSYKPVHTKPLSVEYIKPAKRVY